MFMHHSFGSRLLPLCAEEPSRRSKRWLFTQAVPVESGRVKFTMPENQPTSSRVESDSESHFSSPPPPPLGHQPTVPFNYYVGLDGWKWDLERGRLKLQADVVEKPSFQLDLNRLFSTWSRTLSLNIPLLLTLTMLWTHSKLSMCTLELSPNLAREWDGIRVQDLGFRV
jgi:hypothetical protein